MCLCSVFAMTCVFPTVAQKHFPRSDRGYLGLAKQHEEVYVLSPIVPSGLREGARVTKNIYKLQGANQNPPPPLES